LLIDTLQLQGNSVELANHHSASRVIQWCLREGSAADKARLLGEVRANIVELSKSKYGRHVVQKVISLAKKEDVPGEWAQQRSCVVPVTLLCLTWAYSLQEIIRWLWGRALLRVLLRWLGCGSARWHGLDSFK
jgi:hypothetical protein